MRHDDPNRPKPTRGIIVVDTSAMGGMSVELPDQFKTESARKNQVSVQLSSILGFLAQNGYEIIVPEMVALEAGVARNGVSLNHYFPKERNDKPFFDRVARFYRCIPEMIGNIFIAPPHANDTTEVAGYVRSVWAILKSHDEDMYKRNQLVALHRIYTQEKKSDYGDVAAYQQIKLIKKSDVPIFYLSGDRASVRNMLQNIPNKNITWLTLSGLYYGMRDNGLLHCVGIAHSVFDDMSNCIGDILAREGMSQNMAYQKIAVFKDTLAGLRPAVSQQPAEVPTDKLSPSRIDRFQKKWPGVASLSKT